MTVEDPSRVELLIGLAAPFQMYGMIDFFRENPIPTANIYSLGDKVILPSLARLPSTSYTKNIELVEEISHSEFLTDTETLDEIIKLLELH